MKAPFSSYSTPLPGYGTSLIDRINVYLHFRRYVKVIAERWLLLIIFTVVGSGIGIWLAVTKPNEYRSTSVLMTPPKISVGGPNSAELRESMSGVDNTVMMMQNDTVIQRTLTRLQEGRDNTNKLVRPTLTAVPGSGGTFIMTVTSTNFEYARSFATAWATEFVDFKKQQRKNLMSDTEARTTQSILTFQKKLDQAQQALDDFQKKNNIATIEDAGVSAQRKLDRAKLELANINMEIQLYENSSAEQLASGAVASANNSNGSPSRDKGAKTSKTDEDAGGGLADRFSADSRYSALTRELSARQRELDEWSGKLKEKHPYIIAARRQIKALEGDRKDDLVMVEKSRTAYIARFKTKALGYPKLIEEYTAEVFDATQPRAEFLRLQEEEKRVRQQLDDLSASQLSLTRMGSDEEQISNLSSGGGSPQPVGPNRPYIIAAGAGFGLILAAAIIFLLHRLDDRLENPEDIEAKLDEPILGQLPEVDKKHYVEGYLILTRMKAHTMFAESLRGVRSALLLSPEGSSKRMLAVTSAVPGDGKTTFTANFAITLANSGNKTLLIDADLRRGNVHGYFEQPLEGGLAEVLQGRLSIKEATRETGISNLWFMRAGERPANPSELLIGPATKELVKELRGEFDYVVFDCPPLTAIDDTFSIAAYLDGLFFVVRAAKTSIRFAKMGLNAIHQRGAPILGLIVNGVPIDNPYYYYTTYYYASYYHRPLTPDDNVYPDSKRRREGSISPIKPLEPRAVPIETTPAERDEKP
jgi:capsular exopolysaccharide synthesis family protein